MKFYCVAAVVAGLAIPSVSYAQQQAEDIGKREYSANCAICHGDKGKGDGSFVKWLKKPAADLTKIQKENSGVFPFDRIYQIIDGRVEVAVHGPRDMPIWGDSYKWEAIGMFGVLSAPHRVDSLVRGRILALVGYLYTLQEK